MNWKRIVGGGVITGIILNVGEFGIEPIMAPQMESFFRRLGLSAPGESAMLLFAVLALLLGIVSVWLYVAIRPQFGHGPRTAALAGVIVWLLSCVFPNITMLLFGVFDARLFWFATIWPLIESVVATIAGAKVYREETVRTLVTQPA